MATAFQPGDLVRRFAALHGWTLTDRVILVEGEHDQRYFGLANRLYAQKTGLNLLGGKLSAFPTGIGDKGGAFGLQRLFHPLRSIMDIDLTQDGHKVFHAIALFDNDIAGNRGFAALTGQHLNYRKWRDVFLLQRVLPRTTRDPNQLPALIEKANSPWKQLECEIEDLVSSDIVKEFLKENHNALEKPCMEIAGGIRCCFRSHTKAGFLRFVENNALLSDMDQIVDLLKSLRFHLGLQPDGD